jgi:hypothetical protein
LTVLDLGLEHVGGDLMDQAPELELGGSQDLAIISGGQESGHLKDLVLGRLERLLGEDLGVLLLLGGQLKGGHGAVRVKNR